MAKNEIGEDLSKSEQYNSTDIPRISIGTVIRSAVLTKGNILITGSYAIKITFIDLDNSTISLKKINVYKLSIFKENIIFYPEIDLCGD